MSSESDAGTWDRVAAELRACREAQQRAWGDIDNATLGRYLTGDVNSDERQRVESALDELPELRKLVDLVGDVLNEFEPAAAPTPVVPEPVVLSFKANTVRRPLLRRLRSRSALVAAACLLLTLGLIVFQTFGPSSPPPPDSLRVSSGMLTSPSENVVAKGGFLPTTVPSHVRGVLEPASDRELELQIVRADRSSETLWKQGRKDEARKLVEDTAATVNRMAMRLQKEGELVRAEPLLVNTHDLCQKKLGADHPETKRSLNNLALAYQTAVNTPSFDSRNAYPSPPSYPSATAGGTRPQFPWPGENAYPTTALPGHQVRVVADNPFGKEEKAKEAASALRDRLDRQDPRQLRTSVVPVLTEALKKASSPQERETLARTLGYLGPAAREAVPVLTECLQKSSEPREQQAILTALGQMGPAAQAAAPALVDSLQYENAEARRCAAEAIVRMGPAARNAVPALNRRAVGKDAVAQDVLRRLQGHEGRIGVCDDCDCFSVQALRVSLRQIHTLAESSGVEVLVETVPTLAAPSDKKADDRARDLGVEGVYFLMSRDTPAVQVSVSSGLQKQGLTADRVRAAIEPRLKDKDFDRALVEGVGEVARFEQARRDKKAP